MVDALFPSGRLSGLRGFWGSAFSLFFLPGRGRACPRLLVKGGIESVVMHDNLLFFRNCGIAFRDLNLRKTQISKRKNPPSQHKKLLCDKGGFPRRSRGATFFSANYGGLTNSRWDIGCPFYGGTRNSTVAEFTLPRDYAWGDPARTPVKIRLCASSQCETSALDPRGTRSKVLSALNVSRRRMLSIAR